MLFQLFRDGTEAVLPHRMREATESDAVTVHTFSGFYRYGTSACRGKNDA